MHAVNITCRSFLWDGTAESNIPGKVAWDSVCKPNGDGGLGLINLKLWNVAAMESMFE